MSPDSGLSWEETSPTGLTGWVVVCDGLEEAGEATRGFRILIDTAQGRKLRKGAEKA